MASIRQSRCQIVSRKCISTCPANGTCPPWLALRIGRGLIEERLLQSNLHIVLPGIIAGKQTAMEELKNKIGAAGTDLVIAVKTRRGESARR